MSPVKKLGRNPLQKSKPVRTAKILSSTSIDEGLGELTGIEKLKSLKLQVDMEEFVETAIKDPLRQITRLFRNFQ